MIEVGDNSFGAQTMADCAKVLQDLKNSDAFVYDAETSGLDWQRNHLVGHVIKLVKGPSYYVPVRHAGGGNVVGCRIPDDQTSWDGSKHPFEVEFAKELKRKPRRVVGHNLIFDLRFAGRAGIEFYGDFEDTAINAPLLDENARSYSMENCAIAAEVTLKETGIYAIMADMFGGEPNKGQMANWWRMNGFDPEAIRYAAGDGITTEELWEKQNIYIKEESLELVHSVECRLIRTLYRMSKRGIRVDEEEMARVKAGWVAEALRLRKGFPDWFTKVNAPTQIKRYLEEYIDDNWPRNPVTVAQIRKAEKEGKPAMGSLKFDENALKGTEKGREIINVKKIEHALSSFITPLEERHVWNGRVHCEFNQMKGDEFGTVTGRLSANNPNLQQVPKRNKVVSKPYRRIFLPEEGHLWYDNDYSQQEYVVFTNYTKDPNLVAGYMGTPRADIHTVVAEMLNVERDPTAKRMNLGMLYGMGRVALAGHLEVDERQAMEWSNLYHRKFPYAKKFLSRAQARAKERGYVFTYLGRRRRFPDPRSTHKAGNAVIQGGSADITKLKMVEIDDYFESEGDVFNLMLQCHDSLSWSGPENRPDINAEALRIMSSFGPDDVIKLDVPIAVDSGVGANWSEATFGA